MQGAFKYKKRKSVFDFFVLHFQGLYKGFDAIICIKEDIVMGEVVGSPVDYWRTEDGLMLLTAWARDAMPAEDIARNAGVSGVTLRNWRKKYPEIDAALRTGKDLVDCKVENALLKAALGYRYKEIKVTIGKKIFNGETVELLKETTEKEMTPNVSACLAWLYNRQKDKWRKNGEKPMEIDEEGNNISITIVRGPKKDDLGDSVNNEVKFEKKPGKAEKKPEGEEDRDYWPDDWEEEE